jgi:hypothetical protein
LEQSNYCTVLYKLRHLLHHQIVVVSTWNCPSATCCLTAIRVVERISTVNKCRVQISHAGIPTTIAKLQQMHIPSTLYVLSTRLYSAYYRGTQTHQVLNREHCFVTFMNTNCEVCRTQSNSHTTPVLYQIRWWGRLARWWWVGATSL